MSSDSSSSRIRRQNTKLGSDSFYYVILVDYQEFYLTDSQLLSEPGNLLNLKAIKTGENRDLDEDTVLETDANLFRLIHAHLRGFEIFPLPPQGVPFGRITGFHLSPEATLKNLLRDATDFGLTNLVAKIEREIARASNATNPQPKDEDHEASKEFVMLD